MLILQGGGSLFECEVVGKCWLNWLLLWWNPIEVLIWVSKIQWQFLKILTQEEIRKWQGANAQHMNIMCGKRAFLFGR